MENFFAQYVQFPCRYLLSMKIRAFVLSIRQNEAKKLDYHKIFIFFQVRFGLPSTLLKIMKLEKRENLAIVQLFGSIVANRQNKSPNFLAQKIPARILNILGKKVFQSLIPSYRDSPLKNAPKVTILGNHDLICINLLLKW